MARAKRSPKTKVEPELAPQEEEIEMTQQPVMPGNGGPQQQQFPGFQNPDTMHVDPALHAILNEWDRLNQIPGQVGEDARRAIGVRVNDMNLAGVQPTMRTYKRLTENTPIVSEAYVVADIWSKGCALFPDIVPTPISALGFLGNLFSGGK